MEVDDGDDDGEAPDSDEEKETQRAARLRAAQKGTANEEDDMPGPKVSL